MGSLAHMGPINPLGPFGLIGLLWAHWPLWAVLAHGPFGPARSILGPWAPMGHFAHPYCFFDFINSYGPFEPYGSFGPRGPSLGPWAPMGPFVLFGPIGPSGSPWALSIHYIITRIRENILKKEEHINLMLASCKILRLLIGHNLEKLTEPRIQLKHASNTKPAASSFDL
jgi:hypothetical protein